jgi:hypothetical protein
MKSRLSDPIPFAPFDGLPPLRNLDQKMMRRLRKLANRNGCTVEDLIRKAIAQFAGESEGTHALDKIVRFPRR